MDGLAVSQQDVAAVQATQTIQLKTTTSAKPIVAAQFRNPVARRACATGCFAIPEDARCPAATSTRIHCGLMCASRMMRAFESYSLRR
jgi:hypothetical protein